MNHLFIKRLALVVTSVFFTIYSYAQAPNYYNGTNITQTGSLLKTNLATLISQGTIDVGYTPGVWNALKQTDLDPTNSNNVLLIYGYDDTDTDIVNDRTRSKNKNGGNSGDWNREHSFPKSLGNPNLGTSGPGADVHHLRASDVRFNSIRNNFKYADADGNARVVNGGFYPGNEWKGDVARMMMYMYLRYGNRCSPSAVGTGAKTYSSEMMDIFLEWNVEDPVSTYEINRNVLLEGIQGNRNPFIDNPAFATSIWGGPQAEDRFNNTSTDTEAPSAPSDLVATNVTQTEATLTWTASTDNIGVIAYQIFNGTNQIASTVNTTYSLTSLTANTTYNFIVKAIDAANNTSSESNITTFTTLEDIIITPPTGNVIAYQGYENTTNDTWNYSISPIPCNNGGNDVWDIVTSVGAISSPNMGTNFFGIRDLEGNCGTSDGGNLTFNTIDLTGHEDVTLSFSINVIGFDTANGDTISYETFYDGVSQGTVMVTIGSPFSTTGWEQITQTIPNTTNTVSLTLSVKQNGGSDYAGFDDVQLQGTPIATTPSIIINEVDADQSGTDANEFIELYDGGSGNTSLDGFVIVLYNGSNNLSYNTIDLNGVSTNSNGYFVIGSATVPNVDLTKFTTNGIQNGADAVALYNASATDFPSGTAITTTNLVDAFVYDTNDGDDAELLVLLNTGEAQVNENGAGDKDNHSSQRTPNGAGGTRNTVTFTQLAPTPGEANGEVITPPTATVLINEVDADTPGIDTMEFLELYDGGTGNTSLDGMVVVTYNGSNDTSYGAYSLDGFTTDANGFFVLGNTNVPNVGLIIPSNGLQNGADAVALYTGNATDFPSGTSVTTTNLIDAFVYDTNDGDDTGLLTLLNTGEAQINENDNNDKDNHSSQRFTNGTGGLRNTTTYVQAIPTPGATNTNATEVINLVINEVDADTAGSDTLEFVELYDGGKGNVSLDGFVIVMYNGSNDATYAAYDLDGQTTNAEGYFVLGSTDVPNVNMILSNNGLQNGADAVAIYSGNAADFPSGTAITTSNLIDALVYDTNDADDTALLALLNTSQGQINEGELSNKDGHSNQRIPNGDGGVRNTTTYTQATPTPGTENGAIIPPPAVTTILNARNTDDGELVTVSGVLTVSDQFSGSAYMQDATGGIAIFDELVHGNGNFVIGDSITVTGTRSMFRDQVQINTITSVENNGTPNNTIAPLTITLSELINHPAELVRIIDVTFPVPGDILFGNANYTVTDTSGNGQLRIDNDVKEIVGLGQPETCNEIIGVVGRFFNTYQLLPRLKSDISCAGPYVAPTLPIQISKDKTFDIVTWNIEWFGDEQNSPAAGNPMSDMIQKDSTKNVIKQLNADIYTVQEIVDEALFTQMVNELPGYDYVLSPAVSRPTEAGAKQKIGFIYNTNTVNVVDTKVLLKSIHPLYNGGDDSALVNYPSVTSRFYATGRLPFMMTADITIDGQTEQYNIVALHARANSGTGAQNRYDMRKYDVEVLKDSLDTHYSNSNLILLGDFNDDVDVTVADVTATTTTFEKYVTDTTNYNIVSKALSDAGLRSFVSRENMIDHIAISNELNDNYINQSVRVHYEFYNSDYTRTTSDHFPVSARFQLGELSVTSTLTNASCNGENDGTITANVSGGVSPYTYTWSNGNTNATAVALSAGSYSLTITDALGTTISKEIVINQPAPIVVSTSENAIVYLGYSPKSCTDLSATSVTGGNAPYTYEWNTGETTDIINVCPKENTTYSITVTDANGCSTTENIEVTVKDVRCGHNHYYPKVKICRNGRTKCVAQWMVQKHLNRGAVLGSCNDTDEVFISNVNVFPNPFRRNFNVKLKTNNDATIQLKLFNCFGRKVFQKEEQVNKGKSVLRYNLSNLRRGFYYLKIFVDGKLKKVKPVIKI